MSMCDLVVEKYVPDTVVLDLEGKIRTLLDRCGIYYRVFSRKKSSISAKNKIESKHYSNDTGEKLQDLIGVRIALYFFDDVQICRTILEKAFSIDNVSETRIKEEVFSPERLNLVCKIPDDVLDNIDPHIWENYPIDQTFEIQIRTVFSEGWHEIEHDVRYKSITEWAQYQDLSRSLNGIFATLETCDWAILQLLDSLAYQEYKNKNWASMLKNKFRLRFIESSLNEEIEKIFSSNANVAKAFYRVDRTKLINFLACENKRCFPMNLSNIVYIINLKWVHNEEINACIPGVFRDLMEL